MIPSVSNNRYWVRSLIIYYLLKYLNNNILWINVCYNHHVLKIIWRLLVLTNHHSPGLLLNKNVWTTLKKYQNTGKCDDQQNLKDIIDAAMAFNPDGVTDNSPNLFMKSTSVKKPSARKPLCIFTNILDVKPKTAKCRIVAAKSKLRAISVD